MRIRQGKQEGHGKAGVAGVQAYRDWCLADRCMRRIRPWGSCVRHASVALFRERSVL